MQDVQFERPCNVLGAMLSTGQVVDADGKKRKLQANINVQFCNALYRVVRRRRPITAIEVGMAYGASTLSILSALRDNGDGGQLISIDPDQSTDWRSIGVMQVEEAGFADTHRLIETPSYLGLPRLLANGQICEVGYIDGWHTFDYVLSDFFYLDKMCRVGGVIGFNDCGWRAVHRCLSFVRKHRKYRELDVGLKRSYRGRNVASTLLRVLERRATVDRYFEKLEDWEPNWNFYRSF